MRRWNGLLVLSLGTTLLMAGGIGLKAAPAQTQSSAQKEEVDAFKAVQSDEDLDEFVARYPHSVLVPYAYRAFYLKDLRVQNYSQAIVYLDKLLALGDRIDLATRLEVLIARAEAYALGCRDEALRTPESYAKARDASASGQQVLSEWRKPANMTEEQFDAEKKNATALLDTMREIAQGGLSEPQVDSCKAVASDPGKFDRLMNEIKAQEPQMPQVR